ncbi:MAG: Ni/Fe hydrogenase subunit alpha [Pseudomonadales bacterium]|jgi:coenzyme F420-reducing hydrogenase alpha subunit|nr:Ni/Fe hydrogenase subunit alpha [Pseudomonadales bacterium]
MSETRRIRVDALARVEGEGALSVIVEDGRVAEAKLAIYEPPRFFEAFLRGRGYEEAPDLTARICGICPVAYQMSAVNAMEAALGIDVAGPLNDLRRLLYCGEGIESHVLHMYMLHLPDFLGYEDAIRLAQDRREDVERGLRMKKAGNALVAAIGGREVHPINVRVGGFHRAPRRRDLLALRDDLARGRDDALATIRLVAGLEFPDFNCDHEYVALRHATDYPMNAGRIASTAGLDIDVQDFDAHFEENHVEHSNALHARLLERGHYFVGPQARYNLNADRLGALARDAAREAGLGARCENPFRSIVVRAVETLEAFDVALRLLDEYREPDAPFVAHEPRAGVGYGCTEAPRGMLQHRYELDEAGTIVDARIVPPTSQNQATIEDDLRRFVEANLALDDEALRWRCEQAVRNYDPCISCATHFLKLEIERR